MLDNGTTRPPLNQRVKVHDVSRGDGRNYLALEGAVSVGGEFVAVVVTLDGCVSNLLGLKHLKCRHAGASDKLCRKHEERLVIQ